MKTTSVLGMLALVLSGCVNRFEVRPDDLRQLDGFDATSPGSGRPVASTGQRKPTALTADSELALTMNDGRTVHERFSSIDASGPRLIGLTPQGGRVDVLMTDITRAAILRPSRGRTIALVSVLIGVVVLSSAVAILAASVQPAPQTNYLAPFGTFISSLANSPL